MPQYLRLEAGKREMKLEKLGRYEILGELGKGAMGVVYLARDPLIGRQLALKTFRLGYSAEDRELEQFRARFLREAQSAGILNHPNIVTIHDVVEGADGAFFIAMEYVKGTDLKQLMQRQESLSLGFVVDTVAQIGDALDYAHSRGVVHRDVKPANVILTADKQVKITDFGIARVDASNLTVEGQLLGTPNYMAPEQIQGQEVDHRADLFSLGVMLYEMLTMHKPFQGDNLTVVTHRIVHDSFTPPDRYVAGLPDKLLRVLDQALQKDPALRYASGAELARDLRAVIAPPESSPQPAAATAAPPRAAGSFLPDVDISPPVTPPAVEAAPEVLATDESPPSSPTKSSQPMPGARAGSVSPRRLALLVVTTLVVCGLISMAALLVVKDDNIVDASSPEQELRRQYLPYLKEGRRLLDMGEPAAALEALQQALALVPDNPQIRRLRDRANQEVLAVDGIDSEQAFVEKRLSMASTAFNNREYQRAIRLADEVLDVEPKNRQARRIAGDALESLERKRRVQERFEPAATRPSISGSGEPAGPDGPASDSATIAQTTLDIDFYTEIGEGILTVYAGQEILYKENFRFVEKSGLLKRPRKKPGRLQSQHSLTAGEVNLKIYVYNKGISTQSEQLTVLLPADGRRVLHITLSESGRLAVELKEG